MMLPRAGKAEYVDVTDALNETSAGKQIALNILEAMNWEG
jgi:hypothetical protein